MQPGSQFLNNLASSPDPGIPYSIVAGNTSIIPAALESQGNKPSLIERLTKKLSNRAISLAFFGQPNDIAVKVDSIKSVKSNRIYPPQIQEVACDHMVYFYHPEGLKGLANAIQQAWRRALKEAETARFPYPKVYPLGRHVPRRDTPSDKASPLGQADSRNLVTATKINNPLVRETINKSRSPWIINIIAGTIAIATGIGTFICWQSQPIQPTEQSQQSTTN